MPILTYSDNHWLIMFEIQHLYMNLRTTAYLQNAKYATKLKANFLIVCEIDKNTDKRTYHKENADWIAQSKVELGEGARLVAYDSGVKLFQQG